MKRAFRIYRLPDEESRVGKLMDAMDRFDLTPDYQRQSDLWSEEKRQLFIDSLINGYDVPKLYFHKRPGSGSGASAFSIVDGKQRLEAVREFLKGAFPLSDDFTDWLADGAESEAASGKTYRELTREHPMLATRLMRHALDIIVVDTADEFFIEDMFTRLNEAVALNAPEKRNAFGGAMPPLIRRLANGNMFFTSRLPIENRRYKHFDLATKFLYLTDRGVIAATKKRALDDFVKAYRARSGAPTLVGKSKALFRRTTSILDAMTAVFEPQDELLSSVGLVTVYFIAFQVAQRTPSLAARLTRQRLVEFDNLRRTNREVLRLEQRAISAGTAKGKSRRVRPDLAIFDRLMQSPNDEAALEYRYRILRAFLEEREFKDKLPKDLQRRMGGG